MSSWKAKLSKMTSTKIPVERTNKWKKNFMFVIWDQVELNSGSRESFVTQEKSWQKPLKNPKVSVNRSNYEFCFVICLQNVFLLPTICVAERNNNSSNKFLWNNLSLRILSHSQLSLRIKTLRCYWLIFTSSPKPFLLLLLRCEMKSLSTMGTIARTAASKKLILTKRPRITFWRWEKKN